MKKKYWISTDTSDEIDDAVLTITEKEAARVEWPIHRAYASVFWMLSVIVLCIFGGRVVFLSLIQGSYYRDMAKRNSVRSVSVSAPRGGIYDRFGRVLVSNVPSVDIVAVPLNMEHDGNALDEEILLLSRLLHLNENETNEFIARVKNKKVAASQILVKEKISQEEILLFSSQAQKFPGVSLLKSATRNYVDSLIFSHILGYEGKIRMEELERYPDYALTDSIGKQGLEKQYESVLRGKAGSHRIEVDAIGKIQKDLGSTPPVSGSDLILHIDADLQKKIFDALRAQLEAEGLTNGAAIAMDPRDGSVLALVSYPSFDNNLFANGIAIEQYNRLINDPFKPLFNRAVSGEYPPGSTIKPLLAAGALMEGVIDENTKIESRGGISIGNFFFGDWKVHGLTNVKQAIAVSSDVFFYSIGGGYGSIRGLGMILMKKYETLFGLGAKTGIDITGEAEGFLPDPEWKKEKMGERWYIGDDYHASIGQGFVLATPLQMINAIVAIANGGTLYEPHIVSHIRDTEGAMQVITPHIIRDNFIQPDILRIVREGMRLTVTEGTAQSLNDLPVAVAGKTGTAEFGNNKKTQGWFEAFAPYENPQIALIVLTEGQEEHGYNAVPIAKEIFQWYFTEHRR